MGDVLVLEQLHYHADIRSATDVPRPDTPVKDGELALARQLIQQTAVDEFRPDAYRDQVRERVLEAIQRKVDGQDITSEPTEAPETKIIDLMDALKASLAKRNGAAAAQAGGQPSKNGKEASLKETAARPRRKASGAR
jgi:DNA end-binding protein Ku